MTPPMTLWSSGISFRNIHEKKTAATGTVKMKELAFSEPRRALAMK